MARLVKKLLFCGAQNFRSTELPKGHIWLCVGMEERRQRRFEVVAHYLNHPLFEELLRLSVDKFGYSYEGALRIACEAELFLHVVDLLRSGDPSIHYMELQDVMEQFYATAGRRSHRYHTNRHRNQQWK